MKKKRRKKATPADDIRASLREARAHAEGKTTKAVTHRRRRYEAGSDQLR
jgi:hypothetical protein